MNKQDMVDAELIKAAKNVEEARLLYTKARLIVEMLRTLASEANSRFRMAEARLVELMQEREMVSTKHKNGATFAVSPRLHVSITLGNKDEVADWLVARGYQREDVVREELVPTRVREIVREVYEKEGKVKIPACLKLDDSPGITVTNWEAVAAAPSAPEA